MIEERTAADWYRKRAEHATDYPNISPETRTLYRHIADEEDRHYDELNARLQGLGKEGNPVTPEVKKIADVNQWAKNMDMFPTEVKFGSGVWRDSKVYGGIQGLLKVLKPGDLVFVRRVTLETTLFYSVENIGGKIEVTDRSFPTEASE